MNRERKHVLRLEALESREVASATAFSPELPAVPLGKVAGPDALLRTSAAKNVLDVKFWDGRGSVGAGVPVGVYDNSGHRVLSLTTGADGKVTFNQLPAGTYRVAADFTRGGKHFHGYYDINSRVSHPIWVQEVVTPESNKPVLGPNDITVTVRKASGAAAAGVRVRLLDANRNVVAEYRTNSDGRVAFWQLGERRYYVQAFDAAHNRWLAPTNGTFIDYQSTGSRSWDARFKLG
jgi:hypothetical protein